MDDVLPFAEVVRLCGTTDLYKVLGDEDVGAERAATSMFTIKAVAGDLMMERRSDNRYLAS
jgi:hypothetical protein